MHLRWKKPKSADTLLGEHRWFMSLNSPRRPNSLSLMHIYSLFPARPPLQWQSINSSLLNHACLACGAKLVSINVPLAPDKIRSPALAASGSDTGLGACSWNCIQIKWSPAMWENSDEHLCFSKRTWQCFFCHRWLHHLKSSLFAFRFICVLALQHRRAILHCAFCLNLDIKINTI